MSASNTCNINNAKSAIRNVNNTRETNTHLHAGGIHMIHDHIRLLRIVFLRRLLMTHHTSVLFFVR